MEDVAVQDNGLTLLVEELRTTEKGGVDRVDCNPSSFQAPVLRLSMMRRVGDRHGAKFSLSFRARRDQICSQNNDLWLQKTRRIEPSP